MVSAPAAPPSPLPHAWASYACLDLVNSRWADHQGSPRTYDRLPLPEWRLAFLKHWDLTPETAWNDASLERFIGLRRLLRDILEDFSAGRPARQELIERLNRWMAAGPTLRRLGHVAGAYRLEEQPQRRDWAWVAAEVAGSAAKLLADDEPSRLKVCANPSCTWMFIDRSRNASRRWCEAEICGNLIKVRRFRARPARRLRS